MLVASNAGTASDPAWLLNIRANPRVSIKIGEKTRSMVAHEALSAEKATFWPRLTRLFPKWQMMADRSKREFPVVVLEPDDQAQADALQVEIQ